MKNRKTKNNAAFTGLEAAIVLIAFVVVAAVFSYVMLGAGFFTSQKSKEVVHTGVSQATSSVQTSGDITGKDVGATGTVTDILVTLSLTAGNNPVDMAKLVVSYKDSTHYSPKMTFTQVWIASNEDPVAPFAGEDGMLDQFEKVRIDIDTTAMALGTNTQFTLEVKPAAGAILPITLTTPPVIKAAMTLV